MTPMLRQYYDLKSQCPGFILFFRMGDFYELFGEDAEIVAPRLQIVLTARESGSTEKTPFCGVPHHSARNYWIKLLQHGFKIAVADQVEDPSTAKGLVRREITKYLTPGCNDDIESLDESRANYLCTIVEDPKSKQWCVVAADISTGDLRFGVHPHFHDISQELLALAPSEILVRSFARERLVKWSQEQLSEPKPMITILSESALRQSCEQFSSEDIANKELVLSVVNATLSHLSSLHFQVDRFTDLKPLRMPVEMDLNPVCIRDLEIFLSARRQNTEGSLFREINRCKTSIGQRLLQSWFLKPLVEPSLIKSRHDRVEILVNQSTLHDELRAELSNISDLKRLTTRILTKNISASELFSIWKSIRSSQRCAAYRKLLGAFGEKFDQQIQDCLGLAEVLECALISCDSSQTRVDTNPGQGSVFKQSYDSELANLIRIAQNGQSAVDDYESHLKTQTGIGSLKIREHKTFGLLVEVTKTHLSKVPDFFIRKQTMVNCERFLTEELVELDHSLRNASSLADEREKKLFAQLVDSCVGYKTQLHSLADTLAELDVIQSFATRAREGRFCKSTLSKRRTLKIKAGRHPVVERFVGQRSYTSNDLNLSEGTNTILITGPNMAGKSTLMRQTAIIALLNQMGSFVPAEEAELPIFDQIFTRIGASDDLSQGQSTFMVEMVESAFITRKATKNSLVIIDEVGRGTSTQDGVAIASAILEFLSSKTKSFNLFATHFHELIPFAQNISGIQFLQTEVSRINDELVFTHRLVPGHCASSFGIDVAKLAGIPKAVIDTAKGLMDYRELKLDRTAPSDAAPITRESQEKQGDPRLALVASKLNQLRLNRTTPIQALNTLFELQALLNAEEQPELFLGHPN